MSIGEVLAAARDRAGLNVTQVSQRTRIRETIVREIERDDFSACGGDFYARGHIRAIARAAGADPEPLIREYDSSYGTPDASAAGVSGSSAPLPLRKRRRMSRSIATGRFENGLPDRTPGFFPTGRSRGVTVAVDGFFAFVWFGWGQAAAPSWLVVPFAVGTGLAALLAVVGVLVTRRSAGRLPAMSDPVVQRRYNVTVGVEFGLLGAGAAVFAVTGQYRWIPVWICFGVGVHFFPLASTLQNPSLRPLGVLLVAVAAAALMAGLASPAAPSTITGAGAGLCLLAFGLATLLTGDPP